MTTSQSGIRKFTSTSLCSLTTEASTATPPAATTKLKQQSLPEFLLKTLGNSKYNPTVVRWEDREAGVFRIVQGTQLAQLWRKSRKKTSALKYEFFARAMR